MSCGIYKWTSPNGKSYIGQSVNLEYRKQDFINRQLYTSRNEYSLTVIDRARKKYPDFEQWTYEILEYCEPNELNDREQFYINLFDTFKNGYNETSGGGQNFEISDETKEKLRQANLGKTHSDEVKEKIRQANLGKTPWNKGKTLSDETKEKISNANLGKTLSDETKEKISNANLGKTPWIKGKTHSDETREKIRQAHIGKTHSDEAKEKLRQANIGKTLSEEHKERLRQAHIGKTHSDEAKEKMRQARLGKTPWIKGKTHSDEAKEKIRQGNAKQVDQYSLDGTYIQSFPSTIEIERQLGFAQSNISACCNGKRKSAYGFLWRYHN